MTQLFANNAASKLAGAVALGAVSLTLKTGDGAKFPTPSGGDFFLVTLYQKVGQDEVNHEIVKCTARVGDVLTVVRAQEGTTARAFSADDPVELRLTAGALTAKQDALISSTNIKTINGASVLGSGNLVTTYRVAQYTASAAFVVPANTYVIRPYAFGKGGDGAASASGGGGGCAYGDIAVTPGQSVTLSIAAGVAKVTVSGVDLLIANPASGVTAGTASKHASVTNGGAYSGGAGASGRENAGGASSGSPLGAGVSGVSGTADAAAKKGGSGWGGGGTDGGGGGVGSPGASFHGGNGLLVPSTDPLLAGLTGLGGARSQQVSGSYAADGQPGSGGGGVQIANAFAGRGGFGAGGGGCNGYGSQGFGAGGFGGGGGAGGNGGFGGGGGAGATPGTGGAAVIRIYY